jgi:TetR/AcrR family transcriptional regulator
LNKTICVVPEADIPRGRKKIENQETPRRILAAAEGYFAAHGLAGARTDEIARTAHVNKAMLYYYFQSKQRLHRAVLENLFREFKASVHSQWKKSDPPRAQLLALTSGYFDFLAAHPNYPRLLQREAMELGENFAWILADYLGPFRAELARAVRTGIAAGEIRAVDPDHTVFSILGMTMSYFAAAPIFKRMARRDLLSRAALAVRRRSLLDFLEHGLIPGKCLEKGCTP